MKLAADIVVERARDVVYDALAARLFETYHLWNTGVIELRQLTDGPVRMGSRGVALNFLRRGKRDREEGCAFEVVKLMPDVELAIDESDSHFAVERTRKTVTLESQGGRTRIRIGYDLTWGNDWVGFARPFVWLRRKKELRRALRRLKQALEAPSLPPPPRRPR